MTRNLILSLIIIAALGFAVYANSTGGKFVWDDRYLITHDIYIKNLSYLPNIFKESIGAGVAIKSTSYRPVQMLTYMADYSVWKLNPFGYHLTNVLFHIAAALCIFWLINILFGNNLISLLTAALFVVHPIHTEAVSYISGRADPMALTFMLLAFVFYVKIGTVPQAGVTTRWGLSLFLCSLCYTLALLSRESSIALPFLILSYHYFFKKPVKLKRILPFFIIALIYILFRSAILKSPLPHNLADTTLLQRLPGFFTAIFNYIKLLIFPFDLHMEYGPKPAGNIIFKAFAGILLLAALIFLAVKERDRNKPVAFAAAWFVITILPVSNIYPLNTYMAEHWLYLPSVGMFLMVAGAFNLVISNQVKKVKLTNLTWLDITRLAITASGILALIAFWSVLTIHQNISWRDPIVFYERLLKYAPASARLSNDVGLAYSELGRNDDALRLFKKAVEIDPAYANPYSNIATMYFYFGKRDEAIKFFKKAIEIDPNLPDPYNNLANIYQSMEKYDEAIELYKKAININPIYAEAYNNLAAAYYYNKQYDLAVQYCDKAFSLGFKANPEFLKMLEQHRK